tara:strand:+ start:112 stop:330 length:219 start_codon:yes stop_codon:yes gene_type:complete
MKPSSILMRFLYLSTLLISHVFTFPSTEAAFPEELIAVSTAKKDLSVAKPTPLLTTLTEVITPFAIMGVKDA